MVCFSGDGRGCEKDSLEIAIEHGMVRFSGGGRGCEKDRNSYWTWYGMSLWEWGNIGITTTCDCCHAMCVQWSGCCRAALWCSYLMEWTALDRNTPQVALSDSCRSPFFVTLRCRFLSALSCAGICLSQEIMSCNRTASVPRCSCPQPLAPSSRRCHPPPNKFQNPCFFLLIFFLSGSLLTLRCTLKWQ